MFSQLERAEATEACGCGWRRGRKCGWPHTRLQAADSSRRASLCSTYCGFATHPVTLANTLSFGLTISPLPHGTMSPTLILSPEEIRTKGHNRMVDARDQHRAWKGRGFGKKGARHNLGYSTGSLQFAWNIINFPQNQSTNTSRHVKHCKNIYADALYYN